MMRLRAEHDGDQEGIRAVHEQTAGVAEADLVDALRAEGAVACSLVATDADGAIIGHVLLSRARLVPGGETIHALAPLGVLPGHDGQGVGTALCRQALTQAATPGLAGTVVLGDPAFYARFKFRPARARGVFPPVEDWPDAAWMMRQGPSSWPPEPPPGGVVEYPEAFAPLL